MIAGGVDDHLTVRRLDGEVPEVGVMVDKDGGHGFGLILAGLGVIGHDRVARLE